MSSYVRPTLDLGTFHDPDGSVIPYGRRWLDRVEEPPDDTYSVTLHPQRFAPLQDVARALVDHLVGAYDVEHVVDGDLHRLTPCAPDAAPLTVRLTAYPGVSCRAGVLTDLAWFCTCDHCDEDVLHLAEQLEDEVFAVVEGRFKEWVEQRDDRPWASRELIARDGSMWSGGGGVVGSSPDEQDGLRRALAGIPARWAAWPARPA